MEIKNTDKLLHTYFPQLKEKGENKPAEKTKPTDRIEISNTSKAFKKMENFLNLGVPGSLDMSDLNEEEQEEFIKMLSYLLQKGVVGYEVREVDGKPEKHFIVTQIGNRRLYGTELYDQDKYEKYYKH